MFKLIVAVLVIVGFYFLKDLNPVELNVWTGMREGIMEHFELGSTDMGYQFGVLIGRLLMPFVFSLAAILTINHRRYWLTIVFLTLLVLLDLSLFALLFAGYIALNKRAKDYFNGSTQKNAFSAEVLDDF